MSVDSLIFFTCFIAAMIGLTIMSIQKRRAEWRALLRKVAKRFGLGLVLREGMSFQPRLIGTHGGYRIELDAYRPGRRLRVTVDGGVLFSLGDLSFKRERSWPFGADNSDPQVGDDRFDSAVLMELPQVDEGFALLSSRLRKALVRITRNGGEFSGGCLVLKSRALVHDEEGHQDSFNYDEVVALIKDALELADLLKAAHHDPIANLLSTAQEDPNSAIRLQAVHLLDDLHGESKDGQAALHQLRRARDAEVRIEACLRGHPRDFETIRSVVRDSAEDGEARVRAINALPTNEFGQLCNTDKAMLTELATVESFSVLAATLQRFLRTDHPVDLELLKRCVKRSNDKGRLAAVRLAGSQAEPQIDWLIGLLDPKYPLSSIGAAQALGASHSAKAAPALQRIIDNDDSDDALRRAARAAYAQVQARLSHRGGGLTVFEDGGGRVSLTGGETGALSQARRPQKQKT
jgi:hypothetical protein